MKQPWDERLAKGFVGAVMAAAVSVFGLATPARAMVTLDTTISNISCGITRASGETVLGDCDTLSFAASILPGDAAFLRSTLSYHYTDDGLLLNSPWQIQLDSNGLSLLPSPHEVGIIYLASSNCSGNRYCQIPPDAPNFSGITFQPFILGLNDQPDDLTGSFDFFISMSLPPDARSGFSTTLFLSATPLAVSAPIPEPATLALMTVGLLMLGGAVRQRPRLMPAETA
jgi:hypothetical protein